MPDPNAKLAIFSGVGFVYYWDGLCFVDVVRGVIIWIIWRSKKVITGITKFYY